MVKTTELITYVIFCLFSIIIAIPMIKWNFDIYHRRYDPMVHCRFYPFTAAINILFCCYVLIDRPLANLFRLLDFSGDDMSMDRLGYSILWIFSAIEFTVITDGSITLMVVRCWMIWYDIKWNLASTDNKWAQHISNDFADSDFFIKYRQTWGNNRWMCFFVWLPLFSVKVLGTELGYYLNSTPLLNSFELSGLIFSFTIYTFLWNLTPHYADIFFRRQEMRLLSYVCLALLLSFALFVVLQRFEFIPFYGELAFDLLFELLVLVCAYLMCYCVLRHTRRMTIMLEARNSLPFPQSNKRNAKKATFASIQLMDKKTSWSFSSKPNTVANRETRVVTLSQLLSNAVCFSMLMGHLLLEYSSENLLCITELTQFQMWCRECINGVSFRSILPLPIEESFPQSDIVFNSDHSLDDKIRSLIKKYIQNGAIFEVNLSYGVRQSVDKYSHLSSDELAAIETDIKCHLFDRVITALLQLLTGSFGRWRLTLAYDSAVSVYLESTRASV